MDHCAPPVNYMGPPTPHLGPTGVESLGCAVPDMERPFQLFTAESVVSRQSAATTRAVDESHARKSPPRSLNPRFVRRL